MSVQITISVDGLNQLRRALYAGSPAIRKRLGVALRRGALHVEAAAKLHLRNQGISGATGKLAQSIAVTLDEEKLEARVGPRLQIAPYAHHIELGRKPAGALEGEGPAVYIGASLNRPFLRWLQSKAKVPGMTIDKKGARLAYPIAASIKKKGWRAKPFMAPAAKASEAKVQREVVAGVDRALKEIAGV